MTKRDRAKLREAIRLLSDDRWDAAMKILFPLAGLEPFPAFDVESVSIHEIIRRDIAKTTGEAADG